MKQVIRRGLKEIIVDEVPDPVASTHHVVVAPEFSLISSGTETASIHREGLLKEVADNPSHIRKILDVMKLQGPVRTFAEVRAKFSEYAVLGYSGAGRIAEKHSTVTDLEVGDRVAYGGEGTGHGERILTGRNLVARIPEGMSGDRACFATLGSIALNAVRISSVGIGDTVVVIGLGLVGQLVSRGRHGYSWRSGSCSNSSSPDQRARRRLRIHRGSGQVIGALPPSPCAVP
jgi:threonine dehydrogenase-like Zn-dependent dehydrogenase